MPKIWQELFLKKQQIKVHVFGSRMPNLMMTQSESALANAINDWRMVS
jgi:hypothetical protein